MVQGSDSQVHLQWYEREHSKTKDHPDDDVVVHPGEAELKKVAGMAGVHTVSSCALTEVF